MKKLLLLVACVAMVVGCEKSSIRNGREAYKGYFDRELKDPESLRIYKETIVESDDVSAKFEVEYGAKNSYGGYVRRTRYFHTIGKAVATQGEFLTDITPHAETTKKINPSKKTYPDKYTECKNNGLFAPYEYITHSILATPKAKHSIGQTINLKNDVLAVHFGLVDFEESLKENNAKIFNERFHEQDYLILSKGVSVLIEDIVANFYSVKVISSKETNKYYLPLTIE